jgi:hypothetical protein
MGAGGGGGGALLLDLLDDCAVVADEDVLEQLLVVLPPHCPPVLPQSLSALLLLLSALVAVDEFANALVKLFLLLAVDCSAHFVAFVVVEKYLVEIQTILGLIVFAELLLGLL